MAATSNAAGPTSLTSQMEAKISQFLTDELSLDAMEVGFNRYLLHRPEVDKANRDHARATFKSMLEGFSKDQSTSLDAAVKYYINQVGVVTPTRKIPHLLNHLHMAVANHVVPPRMVCEALLSADKLHYSHADLWNGTFHLVRQIVGGVDYKGVREIMKSCIERAQTLPPGLEMSIKPQVEALTSVLAYIFDRNAALLPGYFIVNEILKSYPENSSWPHWRLVPLVSKFLDSFRPAAAIVSCLNLPRLFPVVEQLGRAFTMTTWKLDPLTLKFLLKGNATYDRILPYNRDLIRPQSQLVRYLLSQSGSKDLVNHVLNLKKPCKDIPVASNNAKLQEQFILLLIECMQMRENECVEPEIISDLFHCLASDLIYYTLFQFISFPGIINELAKAIESRRLKAGRDKLMWLLLQFISGSIQKNPASDFMPVLRLFAMYDDPEPIPLPDITKPECVETMAAACMYIHLRRKAASDNLNFGVRIPVALQIHHEFLMTTAKSAVNPGLNDYTVSLLCNSFSTTADLFQVPMLALVEVVGAGNPPPQGTTSLPGGCNASLPIVPLSTAILDSLSVHSKMSLLHHIVSHIMKLATAKSNLSLSPSIVETYSRLLAYPELESFGIKGFLNQVLPKVYQSQAWNILHTLLEIFSYRTHHIQAHYRLNFLTHIHSMASHNHLANNTQLFLMLENSALRLITGFGNSEVTPPKPPSGLVNKPATPTLFGDSEEMNRVMILTLARAVKIAGMESTGVAWLKEVVSSIMNATPHHWPSHTLENFPPVLTDMIKEMPGPIDNVAQLKKMVEDEWRHWTTSNNEMELIQHFSTSQSGSPLFLCLLWKMILENEEISQLAFKVLERISAKQLNSHLRTFCDFLVHEFSKSGGGGHVNKCIFATNHLIWKYNIITLDRLVLCMALRYHEGEQAQVCFFIIQILLLKPEDFRNRVNKFCTTMSPNSHFVQDWHNKHMDIHTNFPEKFVPEVLSEITPVLPVYYGNVCLRFIPVFDVVLHRFLELPQIQSSLETMLDHLGCLYKFHDRPISYLYNTLFYYENVLRDRRGLRKKIVSAITLALKVVKPDGWALSSEMMEKYIGSELPVEEETWQPNADYYHRLVQRMVHAMDFTMQAFPHMDWRFNEFPNEACHAMYVTCVELMSLPEDPVVVGQRLTDVVLQGHSHIPVDKLPDWINALGIIISNLPESYWQGLHSKIETAMRSPPLTKWDLDYTPTQLFDFNEIHNLKTDISLSYLMAIVHASWHHAGFNQLNAILDLVRDKLSVLVATEEQMLFVLHLVGPFLQRLHFDRMMRVLFDLTVQFYEMLLRVDKTVPHLKYVDTVCDLLYHIKYQFTGDSVKQDVERIIIQLRPALRHRLRFIAQLPVKNDDPNAKQEVK